MSNKITQIFIKIKSGGKKSTFVTLIIKQMDIKTAVFLKSSPDLRQCPVSELSEFAFIGRSNVGKSSLINMLAGRKGLAKVSATPGKTRLINFFLINEAWHLVDLPGYGFAKVSKEARNKLEKMIENYLLRRDNLRIVFVLVDSRHEPQRIDVDFMTWLVKNNLPFVILFTKTDKLTKNQLNASKTKYLSSITRAMQIQPEIVLTSSETGLGKDDVLNLISDLL